MKHLKLYEAVEVTYSFDELSPEVQRQVLDGHREINVEYDGWWETVVEEQERELEEQGFWTPDIQFSGFYSQGDGASFTADVTRLPLFLQAIGMPELPQEVQDCLSVAVQRNSSRYVHENTVDLEVEVDSHDEVIETHPFGPEVPFEWRLSKIAEEIEEKGGRWLQDRCREIYRALEREYDSQQSDEAVADSLRSNEWRFTAEGGSV